MKFFSALFVWFVFAAILVCGILLAARQPVGNPWLLIVGLVGYLGLFVRFGCKTH